MVRSNQNNQEDKSFVTDAWEGFAAKIIPSLEPTHQQYIDMQATFYAGALAILELCNALGDESVDDDKAGDLLGSIHDELKDFFLKKIARCKPSSN